jgi:serine/threonine protein kinase
VAIKTYPASIGQDKGLAKRVESEVKLLGRLSHPNIVALYEVVRRRGKPGLALVIEYMGGGSLTTVLRRRKVSLGPNAAASAAAAAAFAAPSAFAGAKQPHQARARPQQQQVLHEEVLQYGTMCMHSRGGAAAVFAQIAQAVQYLHANGVVHRDIKPDNVLFEKGEGGGGGGGGGSVPVVKLADFGLSALQSAAQGAKPRMSGCHGTLPFMAPEILACFKVRPREHGARPSTRLSVPLSSHECHAN